MLTLLHQPWQTAGFDQHGCRTNWLFGTDGGNQNKRYFGRCAFFYMFARKDRGLAVFQSKWFVLAQQFDVCWLRCSCRFLNKNSFFVVSTTQNILRHVWTEGLVSQLPFTCFVQVAGLDVIRGQIRKSRAMPVDLVFSIRHSMQYNCLCVALWKMEKVRSSWNG